MKIAAWNVNSIRARLDHLLAWLKQAAPDVVLLQEIKCMDEQFPGLEIGGLGYNAAVVGQKAYNGVAVLSKQPINVSLTALPGDEEDKQARYLEVATGGLRLASVYLPNGNPPGTDKFAYKLEWMERLYRHTKALLESGEPFILGGDFNVIPENIDVYDPKAFKDDALFQAEARAGFRKIMHLGLTDALRATDGEAGRYTWWSYRDGARQGNHGARIDFLLLSPQVADRLKTCAIDGAPRDRETPSDHAPVWCELF
ncbi:MAG: exodeoxyribonuclease III [Rhodospirillales bacterium RIFCSPLOWO2_12_FULL_58_28]|nr:MAG: exodeoxyribonuclease III [Rhodospirillales bacterium RIFCSPLOWO2_02_FULL_58_16]OHC79570.1 MAG: exodeoxyribonuclease III [Rhodospirillales bacterium RIFCSPLOWO2_12_FULL_58_28]